MKQQNSRMVVEVNKLIANALLSDGGIYLPEVGSLSIVTTTPESGDPIREIKLSDGEHHKSLINIISERGNCTLQQAEQVFKRWRDVVSEDDTTTIFGIGDIANGEFKITPQMHNKLNPVQAARAQKAAEPTPQPIPVPTPTPEPESPKVEETKIETPEVEETKAEEPKVEEPIKEEPKIEEPKEEKPKVVEPKPTPKPAPKPTQKPAPKATKKKSRGGFGWIIVLAVAIISGIAIFVMLPSNETPQPQPQPQEKVAVEQPATESTEPTLPQSPDEVSIEVKPKAEKVAEEKKPAEPQKAAEQTAPKKPAAPKPASVAKLDLNAKPADVLNSALALGRSSQMKYRVVYGVFSSPENGGNVIKKMAKAYQNNSKIDLRAYPYGKETFVLTLFEANDEATCQEFMRSDLGQSISKELWIYARK